MSSDNDHRKEIKKRKKAKELLEISLKVHNELRPNMKLEMLRGYWGKLTCKQVQETMSNVIKGVDIEADIAAEAIAHTAICSACLEIAYIMTGGKKDK